LDNSDWAVICVNPSLEARAEGQLRERHGLGQASLLFPRHRERYFRRGRRRWRVWPLFPGYAFMRSPFPAIEALELVAGIWDYVRTYEGDVARVADGVIAAVAARLGPQGVLTLPAAERFALGAMVRFKDRRNSLADLCGWYAGRAKSPGRALVEYDLLGRRVPVEVAEAELIAA
jgi:hypothetical protein